MRPFPDVVRIEPYGGNCNFRCRHCPTGLNGGRRGLLKFETFVTLFNRLPFVPRVLVLYHGSEPLINRALEQMLLYAKKRGVHRTVLNTNAALLRPLPALDEMRVSFDGDSPAENDRIRRGSNFERDAAKVKELAHTQRIVVYNVRATGGDPLSAAGYLSDYFGNLVEYRSDPMRYWSSQDELAGYEMVERPTGVTFCANLFNTFTILADGTVTMCCEDLEGVHLQGNALEELPIDIWNRMETMRENFSKRNYPEACRTCWVVAGRYARNSNEGA